MSGQKAECEKEARASEGVKILPEEQNISRKDAKAQRAPKQTKGFSFALLCVFAPLREIVLFFHRFSRP